LNWCKRFCRPLRNHSATWPHGGELIYALPRIGNQGPDQAHLRRWLGVRRRRSGFGCAKAALRGPLFSFNASICVSSSATASRILFSLPVSNCAAISAQRCIRVKSPIRNAKCLKLSSADALILGQVPLAKFRRTVGFEECLAPSARRLVIDPVVVAVDHHEAPRDELLRELERHPVERI
jgi:hypothetical protein